MLSYKQLQLILLRNKSETYEALQSGNFTRLRELAFHKIIILQTMVELWETQNQKAA
jgi:hypothetical protein